jgi:hypothetical protein
VWRAKAKNVYRGPWNRTTAALILVAGNTYDPDTASTESEAVAIDRLARGHLITVIGNIGHGIMNNPSACAWGYVNRWATSQQHLKNSMQMEPFLSIDKCMAVDVSVSFRVSCGRLSTSHYRYSCSSIPLTLPLLHRYFLNASRPVPAVDPMCSPDNANPFEL